MSKTVKTIIIVILVAVLGIAAYFVITSQIRNSKKVFTSRFDDLIEDSRGEGDLAGDIPDDQQINFVRIDGYVVYGYLNANDATYTYWANYTSLYSDNGKISAGDNVEWKSTLEFWKSINFFMFAFNNIPMQFIKLISASHFH